MKRGTIEHPKTLQLSSILGLEKWGAVGILESLWHWTSRYAIQGDIGKWSDENIASGIGWTKDPAILIDALVKSGWIDRVKGKSRLVIHDLKDHADNTWKQNLTDLGLTFWDGKRARGKGKGCRTDLKKLEVPTSSQPQANLKKLEVQPPQPEPEPEPEPKKSEKPARDPSPNNFGEIFTATYKQAFGVDYHVNGGGWWPKAGQVGKQILQIVPTAEWPAFCEFFFQRDGKVKESGFPVTWALNEVNAYLQSRAPTKKEIERWWKTDDRGKPIFDAQNRLIPKDGMTRPER